MIDKLIKGISTALYNEFGDGYTIYDGELKQGMKKPCFFVLCVESAQNLFLGQRYRHEHKFCIHFFADKDVFPATSLHEIAERLYGCLEHIEVDGLYHGMKMSHEISDGVLLFFVSYNFYVYKIVDLVRMGSLKIDVEGKENEDGA